MYFYPHWSIIFEELGKKSLIVESEITTAPLIYGLSIGIKAPTSSPYITPLIIHNYVTFILSALSS